MSCEGWDWRTPEDPGISGSETAVVELSQRLAKRGHDVTVYANLREDTHEHPDPFGVKWESVTGDVPIERDPGVWILCRCPWAIDHFQPDPLSRGQKLVLRCDDVHYKNALFHGVPNDVTPERLSKVSSVICMSPQHRDVFCKIYPFVPREFVETDGSGIPSDRIRKLAYFTGGDRDPYRIIWASSADRGLDRAIEIFNAAREKEPRLNLHVYYGWQGADRMEQILGPGCHPAAFKRRCLSLDHGGITWHGRTTKTALYEGYRTSSIYLYPTTFHETGCCSAQESLAFGHILICPTLMALERVAKFGILIDGDPRDPVVFRHYVDSLLHAVEKPHRYDALRQDARTWALKEFDWEKSVDMHERLAGIHRPRLTQVRPNGTQSIEYL